MNAISPAKRPMNASLPKSNAGLSQDADVKSKGAEITSQRAKDEDPQTHQVAASAHQEAAYAQRAAGNGTKADEHEAKASMHMEKADAGNRAKMFADQEGQAAEKLSKKADMAVHGKDPKDPRAPDELHKDAMDAHERAASAYGMAGDKRSQSYHEDKAKHHQGMCGASSSGTSSATDSGSHDYSE